MQGLSGVKTVLARLQGHGEYHIRVILTTDYTFSSSTDTMIKIDSLFPDVEKSVSGTEHIDDYFNDNQCSLSQQNAIKKMFMIKQ